MSTASTAPAEVSGVLFASLGAMYAVHTLCVNGFAARLGCRGYSQGMASPRRDATASAQTVYAALRDRLARADYAAGDRLTEQTLAEELGVSRTPVREALGRLLADGLVTRSSRGVVVAALDDKEHDALFALRAVLEAFAAELAARRQAAGYLAPVVLDDMDAAAEEVSQASRRGDGRAAARANIKLHRQIAAAADNGFLLDTLSRVWDRIAVATVSNLTDQGWLAAIPAQHHAVAAAIRSGDPSAAHAAMTHHIACAAGHSTRHPV
jgi:DNA-binding GntR family transcriptional regulator